jgi:FAD/FMN-containing dehydrogenase
MARFNRISKYVPGASSRDVEAGCLFDEVYRAIVPTGQNIVGGSAIAGVGIAGWLLGGGYSLKTNQYGLGIDNILGFRIVLPNGAIEDVTEQSNKELFEAVKVRICFSCRSYVSIELLLFRSA